MLFTENEYRCFCRHLEAVVCRWNTYVVDGHDVDALCRAFYEAGTVKDKPTCLLAKTFKGRGIPGIEDADDWHGRPIGPAKSESVIAAIKQQIVNPGPHGLRPCLPADVLSDIPFGDIHMSDPPAYKLGDKVCSLCCSSYVNIVLE